MFELHYVVDLNELNDDDDDDNHPCHIFCQSVEGFLGGSTPKMAISYTFSNDPYNSTALPCRLVL